MEPRGREVRGTRTLDALFSDDDTSLSAFGTTPLLYSNFGSEPDGANSTAEVKINTDSPFKK